MSFWAILALIVLAIALVAIIIALNKPKTSDQRDQTEEFPDKHAHLDVGDARPGDGLSIPGQGDDFEDLDLRIERRDRFESGGERWYQLTGKYRGRRVYVELVEDDDLEVWLDKNERSLRIDELGIDEEMLAHVDESKDYETGFEFDGERFTYSSSEEVGYFENGYGDGEGFYSWTFENRDRNRQVWVEKWIDEPFEAGTARRLRIQDVRLFRA